MFNCKGMKEGYIDIHTHIVPYTDDGATDIETALEMLSQAYADGTRIIVATPHFHPVKVRCDEEEIYNHFLSLKEKAETILPELKLEFGRECLCNYDFLESLENGTGSFKLCSTKYVLIEFNVTDEYAYIVNCIRRIQMCGYLPVIAHIERYRCMLDSFEYVENLYDLNVIIQVNAMSVTGDNGRNVKKFVMNMIKRKLVHVVATDAHSTGRRNPRMSGAFKVISRKFGEETARKLFVDNPQKIIEGRYLEDN